MCSSDLLLERVQLRLPEEERYTRKPKKEKKEKKERKDKSRKEKEEKKKDVKDNTEKMYDEKSGVEKTEADTQNETKDCEKIADVNENEKAEEIEPSSATREYRRWGNRKLRSSPYAICLC